MHELTTAQCTSYLRQLLQRIDMLILPLGSGLSFSLVQVFQPLRLRQSSRDAQETLAREEESPPTDDAEEDEHVELVPPQQVLAENGLDAPSQSQQGRLVILGSPGSGKTTMLKHLVYHHAHLALENPDAALPLFLSLPDLARSGQDLPAYLAQQAADLGLERDAGQAFVQAIEQGHAFICLDSLDEVLPRQRAEIIRQINALAHHPGNIWIVGSRFTDYKGGQFEPGRFQEWELQPLDTSRQLHLAAHLLPTIQRQLSPHASETHSLDPGAYVRALGEHRQAASWGENPLLLSLAAVVYLRQGTLSGSRSRLYREVIDAVLETRQPDPHQRTYLRGLLAEVALDLYQRKGRTFHASDLRATLSTINTEQHATWSIESTLTALLNSGVLDGVSFETYSFRHQTFQEYLVASALASRFMSDDEQVRAAGEQFAWSKHTYSRWHEIQRLLAGILVQEYGAAGVVRARAWLERMLRQQESPEGDPGNLSLELALKLLGEIANLEEWLIMETEALEEKAAHLWISAINRPMTIGQKNSFLAQRLHSLAPEIGHLRPSIQAKIIPPLFTAVEAGDFDAEILGAIRSRVVAEQLRTVWPAWQKQFEERNAFKHDKIFEALQEYAPLDLLLPLLQMEHECLRDHVVWLLETLEPYVLLDELLPLLSHERQGTRQAVSTLLIAYAGKRSLPLEPLLVLCASEAPGAFEAARVLARLRHPAALEPLMLGLVEGKGDECRNALEALNEWSIQIPLEHLMSCLHDADFLVREYAVEALSNWGQDAPLESLVAALNDPIASIKVRAVKTLDRLQCQSVPIPAPLLVELSQHPQRHVASAAIRALGHMGQRAPLELLLSLLDSPTSECVDAALEALGTLNMLEQVPEKRLQAFFQESWFTSQSRITALRAFAPRLSLPFLLTALQNTQQQISQSAAEILGQKALPWHDLLADVGDNAQVLRRVAIIVLAHHGTQDDITLLLQALHDESPDVSLTASYPLRKIANQVPVNHLLNALQHPASWVRRHAIEVLAQQSIHPPLLPLIAALHDSDPSVRMSAARLFATWEEDAPLNELVAAALDTSEEVRCAAAVTLGKVGRSNPTLALQGILKVLLQPIHNDHMAETDLSQALTTLSPLASSAPLLQAMHNLCDQQRFWLLPIVASALAAQAEKMPVADLHAVLHHPENNMCLAAVRALRGAGPAAPIDDIIALLDGPQNQLDVVIATLVNLAPHVPSAVFLRIWHKQLGSRVDMADVLTAIKQANGQIPLDILAQIPQRASRWQPALHHLLVTLNDLTSLPMTDFTILLAMSCARFVPGGRHPQRELIVSRYRALVPHAPLSAWLEGLQSPQADIRRGCLMLSVFHPEASIQEVLFAALADPDQEVQETAIKLLRVRSIPLPIQKLLACLAQAGTALRKTIIAALGTTGRAAPLAELLAQLDHSNSFVRAETVKALGQPGLIERVHLDVFLAMTGDIDRNVRDAALKVLKAKDPQQAIACCLAALGGAPDSPHPIDLSSTYQTEFAVLQELAPELIPEIVQEARTILQGRPPTRFFHATRLSFIADTTGKLGRATPELLVTLGEMLNWPHWKVRMKAARALGTLRRNIPDDTIRRLLELRRDPRSRAVREAADEALAEILSLETGIEDD